jgi:hypothetical protein
MCHSPVPKPRRVRTHDHNHNIGSALIAQPSRIEQHSSLGKYQIAHMHPDAPFSHCRMSPWRGVEPPRMSHKTGPIQYMFIPPHALLPCSPLYPSPLPLLPGCTQQTALFPSLAALPSPLLPPLQIGGDGLGDGIIR